jgi:hypothetical protein
LSEAKIMSYPIAFRPKNEADNVCFRSVPQGPARRFGRRALCQIPRNKMSIGVVPAKLSVAPGQNNLRFSLEGHPKFCHTEFRTVLLSYLTQQPGWIWRMFYAGPAFAATETGWS